MPELLPLVEAFRDLGPTTGDPAVDAVRSAAATRILEELRRIAGRGRPDQHLRDEAVSLVLLRLVQRSHRNRWPAGMPASEEDARAYLAGALRNNLNEVRRGSRGAHLIPLDAALVTADEDAEPSEAVDHERARVELENARHQLFDVVVPELAARRRSDGRETFLAAVADLRAISEGHRSVANVVAVELKGAQVGHDTPEWQRARNNVDQRFSRVLREILTEVRGLRERGRIGETRYRALRVLIDEIRPGGERKSSRDAEKGAKS